MGVTLAILSVTLIVAGRRRPEGWVLAFFLTLVATNFLAGAAFNATGNPAWQRVAFLVLPLDPFFLLLFTTSYPYPRRGRAARALLAVMALVALVGEAAVALSPAEALVPGPLTSVQLYLVLELTFAYTAAWFISVRAAATAPTPLLERRAAWLVAAVGIAVVHRIGLVPSELKVSVGGSVSASSLAHALVAAGIALVLVTAGVLAGGPRARERHRPTRQGLLAAGVGAGVLVLVHVAFTLLYRLDVVATFSHSAVTFSLRWPVFAFLLVIGMLSFEVVEFDRASGGAVAVSGGLVGALAAGLTAGVLIADDLDPQVAIVLSVACGLAALVPAGVGARSLARAVEARSPIGARSTERRLALYRATLEAEYARGAPSESSRADLERERRAFGVSIEEARALEHAVAAQRSGLSRPIAPGEEVVAGVVVERAIGTGAHGRVFLATRFPSRETVVVKEFVAAASDAETTRRLGQEMRALAALDHPNVVRLIDVSTSPGRHLLVMEHLDGGTLAERLARGAMPEAAVRDVLDQALAGLGSAHARGIVHRDVKPSNVFLARDGRACLGDFGVATLTRVDVAPASTVTSLGGHGAIVGTLAYMAPEQVTGGPVGPATDLYALGLVAFEALTGLSALDLEARAFADAVDVVAHPRVALESAPPHWRAFLARALAIDPRLRFESAAAMRAALPALREPRAHG